MAMPNALIVDHDAILGRSWSRLLGQRGWHTERTTTLRRARMLLASTAVRFDAALLDLDLQEPHDLGHLPGILRLLDGSALVLVSAADGAAEAQRLTGRCDALLLKPVRAETLLAVLAATVCDRPATRPRAARPPALGALVGDAVERDRTLATR